MFRKLTYLLIVGSLCLAGLLLIGCSQSNQDSSIQAPAAINTATSIAPTPTSIPATPTPIPPTATPAQRVETLHINQFTASDLTFQKDEFVWIQPSGEVKVGPFVGFVGPEGRDSWLLASYSIVPNIPHGALLCRIKGQTEWSYCGEELEVQLKEAGQLEFQVNDNDQSNNDPNTAFMVRITVAPYSAKGRSQPTAHSSSSSNSNEASDPNNGQNVVASNPTDPTPIDYPTRIGDDDQTHICLYRPDSDSACLDLCRNDQLNPNCRNQVDYMKAQDKQDQQQRDDEERRQRQQQEDDQRRRDEEEQRRRQQEEEDRQRQQQEQQQQQQQDNSSGN